jgi:hypothetical protein
MAIPGHPFLTPELDELRSLQRRQLRDVPMSLLERYHLADLPAAGSVDAFTETALRLLADQEARNMVELLESFELHAIVECQLSFLSARDEAGDGRTEDFAIAMVDLASRLAASQTALFSASADEDRAARLERFVKLLLWADQLADDGYVDPRVATITEPAG